LCPTLRLQTHGGAALPEHGDLYSEIEDFEVATQNYRKAQELLKKIDDPYLSNYVLIAEANLALLKREPGPARSILEEAAPRILAETVRLRVRISSARAGPALTAGGQC